MKVAIIGSNGQLGNDLMEAFGRDHQTIGLTHHDIEISDIDNVRTVLTGISPDVVINTAAYHNVPLCEQNQEMAFRINGKAPQHLAAIANEIDATLIHYSTDYVFDGSKNQPYTETDRCNPLNVYAVTKLSGEHFVLNYAKRPVVIRVSGIYGKVPCRAKGGNFITTMLKLSKEKPEVRVVNDEILTPTPTSAIAENTLALAATDAFGLYHMSCAGEVSWYEFARTIWDALHLTTPLYPASVKDFPLVVKRPFYSVLENKNLEHAGINNMPYWKDALLDFIKKM